MKWLLLVFLTVLFAPSVWAGASNNIAIEDSVYDDLDRLISLGVADDTLYGQRPWSENEVRRIIRRGEEYILAKPNETQIQTVKEIVSHLRLRFDSKDDEGKFKINVLKRAAISFSELHSSSRNIPVDNGVFFIDGFIHPLVENQNGTPFVRGQNLGFQTEHSLQSPFASLFFRPQFQLFRESSGKSNAIGTVQELYGKLYWNNVELEAGRDHLGWGQSEFGGQMLSNNARGLDMVKLSNDSPFFHPWIFKYLGPSKYTFFVSNLGPDRSQFPYAYFYGAKATFKPFQIFEVGIAETIIYGGNGAPPTSWTDPFVELLPINKIGTNFLQTDVSDHKFGFFDVRLTLPWFRYSAAYFETVFDDSPTRALGHMTSDFWDETGIKFGLHVPRLFSDGSLSSTFEYRHQPPWAYRHQTWKTGYTLDRELMGDTLGPDGDGFYLNLRFIQNEYNRIKLNLAYESRGSGIYSQTRSPGGGQGIVFLKTPGPIERRIRAVSFYSYEWLKGLQTVLQTGYEFVQNFNYKSANRNNFILGVQLKFEP